MLWLASTLEVQLARGEMSRATATDERLRELGTHRGFAGALARYARGELRAALGEAELASELYAEAGCARSPATSTTPTWCRGGRVPRWP